MTRVVGRMSDLLLGVFMPKLEAGACVEEHGKCCLCSGGGQPGAPYWGYKYTYDCYGNCRRTSLACTQQDYGTC